MAAVARSTLSLPSQRPVGRPAGGRAAPRGPAHKPDLRLVVPVGNARRYIALLSLLAACGVFGVVSLNALAAESAFEAQTLEADVAGLEVQYGELTAEVAALESPERVERIAVSELGMILAEEPGYLVVAEGSVAETVRLIAEDAQRASAPGSESRSG